MTMPVRTNDHRKYAGKKTALAVVRYQMPLDDPKAEGNLGGVGFDDDSVSARLPNAGLVRHWCRQVSLPVKAFGVNAVIQVERWDETSFDDAGYGRVFDVEAVTTHEQLGYRGADFEWEWDDMEAIA